MHEIQTEVSEVSSTLLVDSYNMQVRVVSHDKLPNKMLFEESFCLQQRKFLLMKLVLITGTKYAGMGTALVVDH